MRKIKIIKTAFYLSALLGLDVLAMEPIPFNAEYEVSFVGGIKAEADLVVEAVGQNKFMMSSSAKIKVFGKTITSVDVNGDFLWGADNIQPQNYEYVQTGLGHRSRSIAYDWSLSTANTLVNDDELSLPLDNIMLDELSMYVEIQLQAAAGVEDIYLNVIDEDKIKEYHYRLLGEEALETDLGIFNTLKYLRVRGEESKRVTHLWLAKDWEYLVVQIQQKTRLKTFQINLLQATVNGRKLTAL